MLSQPPCVNVTFEWNFFLCFFPLQHFLFVILSFRQTAENENFIRIVATVFSTFCFKTTFCIVVTMDNWQPTRESQKIYEWICIDKPLLIQNCRLLLLCTVFNVPEMVNWTSAWNGFSLDAFSAFVIPSSSVFIVFFFQSLSHIQSTEKYPRLVWPHVCVCSLLVWIVVYDLVSSIGQLWRLKLNRLGNEFLLTFCVEAS